MHNTRITVKHECGGSTIIAAARYIFAAIIFAVASDYGRAAATVRWSGN
jgi:CRISPR/Cas system CSM-associated protein Csm4 (group 5 of RAMP superfamily)